MIDNNKINPQENWAKSSNGGRQEPRRFPSHPDNVLPNYGGRFIKVSSGKEGLIFQGGGGRDMMGQWKDKTVSWEEMTGEDMMANWENMMVSL